MFERGRSRGVVALVFVVLGFPAVASAAPSVDITSPALRFDGGERLRFLFEATFKQKPPKSWVLSVKARCVVETKTFVDTGEMPGMLDDVGAGDTTQIETRTFTLEKRLPSTPSSCEFVVRLGKLLDTAPSTVAMFCWNGGQTIDTGRCVSADERARQEEAERKKREKEQQERERAAFRERSKSCSGGDLGACVEVGSMFKNGSGTQKSLAKAEEALVKSCKGNAQGGCDGLDALGVLYQSAEDKKPDLRSALRVFTIACDAKSASACHHLGLLYANGTGTTKDLDKASEFFGRSCEFKHDAGCEELLKLATAYDKGTGLTADATKASALYQRGCDAGDMAACTSLGNFYLDGRAGAPDLSKAELLLAKTCSDLENSAGCEGVVRLAKVYDTGTGTTKNEAKAATLYVQACDVNIADACFAVGEMYQTGRGIAKDTEKATVAFQRACNGGLQKACEALKAVSVPPVETRPESLTTVFASPNEPIVAHDDHQDRANGRRTLGKIVVAGGATVAAASLVFGGLAWSNHQKALDLCKDMVCNSDADRISATDLDDRAASHGRIASVLGGVGGAAIVIGAIVWFTAPPSSTPRRTSAWRIVPVPTSNGAIVSFGGSL